MAKTLVKATENYYHQGNWTIREIRSELIQHGMKKAEAEREIAKQLGVTKRTVERYIAGEEASGKQARGKKSLPKRQEAVNAVGNKLLKPESARKAPHAPKQGGPLVRATGGKLQSVKPKAHGGVHVVLDGTIGVNGKGEYYERDRTIDLHISDDEWGELTRIAQEEGEEKGMGYLADLYGVKSMYLVKGDITTY